ncbi:MAG: ABC transporter ATP-binding protein [Pirellulaceae bacterium]|nr:ABC transporter ATP-binding protein [Pirellulaceae bacterium]
MVISVDHVSKKFGRRTVLSDVSFQVPSGCVFALLGENGAGKSTLIRGLLGYHRFAAGSVRVCDMDPQKEPMALRRRVGYVADAPGMYEWMTIGEAGWYASGFYAAGFLERYANLCADFTLPAEAQIRSLSKGMRAKVALALAMAFDPDLLILDEPTSGLDPLVRRSFLESMVDRAAAGQTVFLSSHQIHEVERVADWVAILHEGRLQVVAPLEDLKTQVRMLTFSLRDTLLALPAELDTLQILHRSCEGRSMRMMVRGMTAEIQAGLERDSNLFELKVLRPNLEELYLGYTQPVDPQANATEPQRVSDVA